MHTQTRTQDWRYNKIHPQMIMGMLSGLVQYEGPCVLRSRLSLCAVCPFATVPCPHVKSQLYHCTRASYRQWTLFTGVPRPRMCHHDSNANPKNGNGHDDRNESIRRL